MLLRLRAGNAHPLDDCCWNDNPRHLVRQKFRVAQRYERPDPGDNRDAHVLDSTEELLQLLHVEDGLSDGILGTGLNLPLEPLEFLRGIDRRWIHSDSNSESGRLADRIATRVKAAIQVADEIGQPDRIDIEDRRRVRIRPHLGRIPGDHHQVAQPGKMRAQQV